MLTFGLTRDAAQAKRDNVLLVDHPLAAAKLTVLRSKWTEPREFRRNLHELALILFWEATRSWAVNPVEVQTPLRECSGSVLQREVVLVPILRAGLGMLDGITRVVCDATIGHLGIYRDEITLKPVSYFTRLPESLADAEVVLLDPMLATGNSAVAAVESLKVRGAQSIQLLSVVSCGPGLDQLHDTHPDVRVVTSAIDPELDDRGYIVPGLGDAGDRYFGVV